MSPDASLGLTSVLGQHNFLKSREDEQRLTSAAAQASEPAFKVVWDNPDDAEYDRL